MAVLVRSNGGQWSKSEQKSYVKEQHLQELLLKSPELIETNDHSRLLLTDEAGLSGGTYADLLGVTSSGQILIIEAKLAANPEIRRKIIGQIFEYAGRLWQTDYASFDSFFGKHSDKSLIDQFSASSDDFDAELFRSTVEINLKTGNFQLLIAVDEMNDELERILQYVNTCGHGLRLEALAFRLYEKENLQVLVPQRYGAPVANQVNNKPAAKITIQDFVDQSLDDAMREKMQLIVQQWQEAGFPIATNKVGLSLKLGLPSKVITMFYATPNETYGIQPAFDMMKTYQMPKHIETTLRKELSLLPGISSEKIMNAMMPCTKFSVLSLEAVRRFVTCMVDAATQWRESLAVSTDEAANAETLQQT